MASDNETVETIAREIETKDIAGYYLANRIRNAHNREMQSLREQNQKLEDCLMNNGLEVEDGR